MSKFGRIVIDGFDGWEQFGLVVLKNGFTDWLAFPDMKQPFSHDWKDEDGIEVDLTDVYIKEKNVSLQFIFIASSAEVFWENYAKLQQMLTSPGIRSIYLAEMSQFFNVFYTKTSNVSKPTRLKKTNKIVVEMTVHFTIPVPAREINLIADEEGIEFWSIEQDFVVS